MRDIGKNIRDLRELRGLTQEELAGKLFVTRQTVSNYETGRSRPDLDMLLRIAGALGTDPNTLLYGLPGEADRRSARRRLAVCGGVLAVMTVLYLVLRGPAAELMKKGYLRGYFTYSYLLLQAMLLPCLLFLLGWTALAAAGYFLGARRLTGGWVSWARRGLLVLLAAWAALLCPAVIWMLVQLAGQIEMGAGMEAPAFYQRAVSWLLLYQARFPWLFAIWGAGLWLLSGRTPPVAGTAQEETEKC